jgi:hypothetical protein
VRPVVPQLFENDDTFYAMLEKREAQIVSSRSMRLPVLVQPGGVGSQASLDNADLGRGSGPRWDVATVSPFYYTFAVEISKQSEFSTEGRNKAVKSAVREAVRLSMAQFRSFLDKLCQTSGSGVLGTISSIAGSVLTMASPTFELLFYIGETVQVYDTTLATNRGSATVTAIDNSAHTVTLGVVPAGTVATDALVVSGLSGALTIQSSLFGLKYHHSNASTGLWMNLNRATYPQIITPRVNGNNAALTAAPIRLAQQKIRLALGANAVENLIAYCGMAQEQAYEELGITISEIIKQPGAQDLELLFQGKKTMAGAPLKVSRNADPTRIDFINLDEWGRAVVKEIDYYEVDGQTIFPIYGTSGGLQSSSLFYFVTGFQIWTGNPRKGAYIDNLAQPTGY